MILRSTFYFKTGFTVLWFETIHASKIDREITSLIKSSNIGILEMNLEKVLLLKILFTLGYMVFLKFINPRFPSGNRQFGDRLSNIRNSRISYQNLKTIRRKDAISCVEFVSFCHSNFKHDSRT